jgi:hypothetical protein
LGQTKPKTFAQSKKIDIDDCDIAGDYDIVVPDIGIPYVDLAFCNCSLPETNGTLGALSDSIAGAAGVALALSEGSQVAST